MSWYLAVLKNYVGFSGRARRTEYWMFALFNAIVLVILEVLVAVTGVKALAAIVFVYAMAVLIPGIAVAVRRLHDTGRSGGWFFIAFVPFIGSIWLLILLVTAGNPGPNTFGPDPKASVEPAAA